MPRYVLSVLVGTLFAVVLAVSACTKTSPDSEGAGEVSGDQKAARQLSDAVAEDLVNRQPERLYAKAERAFRDTVDQGNFAALLDRMYATYGTPLEFEFKKQELGTRAYTNGQNKQMWKSWYAARTTKYDKGTYFLFVEVVRDGTALAFSSFAIVSFEKDVPADLR